MGSELENIPNDVPTLQGLLVASLRREAQLRHLIDVLNRNKFGRKSEKLPADQLRLGLEDQAIAMAEVETLARDSVAAEESLGAKRGRPRRDDERPRASLPPHLPRVEVVLEPDAQECPCCMGALHRIGEDRSERLDIIPAQFRVIVTVRPKMACPLLRRRRQPRSGTQAPGCWRSPDRSTGRLHPHQQICRSLATVSFMLMST